ncbi:PREDICTED: GPI transamidase component PIG-T-like [Branchiostoma belcheri]|uniref:GPI transamidase component PIG-T-like n=1 Tax=Branchiostoma belcheri TaxID=7741 RepID=A0A6P4Y3U0_BRABE|nr:PREDICTED: GPI transamidase component PIG-T-like [Branchiostoma belcheri]
MAALGVMNGNALFPVFLCLFCCVFHTGASTTDEYSEELLIVPFRSGQVYSHFEFTTSWDVDFAGSEGGPRYKLHHFRLFPRALGQVLTEYRVQEMHLTLTQGMWQQDKWGYPVVSAAPGAELWVWFQQEVADVDQAWFGLTNALSGLFCASLNFIDSTSTVTPHLSFRPQGLAGGVFSTKPSHLRYATLPRENVCTENLTPWKKLLPCSTRTGLAALFHAGQLYNTQYSSLGVHLRPVCRNDSCSDASLELRQVLSTVADPPSVLNGKQDWSMKRYFSRSLSGPCPLAVTSRVYVDVTVNQTSSFTLKPEPTQVKMTNYQGYSRQLAVYDLWAFPFHKEHGLNVDMKWKKEVSYSQPSPPRLYVHRFVTGYGQDHGGIMSLLYNRHPYMEQQVIYMELIPWFTRMYLHTLKVETTEGNVVQPLLTRYQPGSDRQSPYLLELVLTLPPDSTTRVSFSFQRAFLKWTEYPPDANHGFYISSAVLTTILRQADNFTVPPALGSGLQAGLFQSSTEYPLRLHTETLLISLPTPDFSMPYNVICLTCTVIAIAFGSLHNLTTRRFQYTDLKKANPGWRARLAQLFGRGKQTSPEDKNQDPGEESEDPGEENEDPGEESEDPGEESEDPGKENDDPGEESETSDDEGTDNIRERRKNIKTESPSREDILKSDKKDR